MPDTENLNAVRDFALGNLLIDLAQVNLSDTGAPVDEEELALFLQPNGKQELGARRCEQILAWLCRDESLYQRWLMLSQTLIPETEYSTQALPTSNQIQPTDTRDSKSLWDWFSGLFYPGLGLAPVLGIVAVSVVATYLLVSPQKSQQLAIHQGEELPAKASQDSVGTSSGVLAMDFSELLKCAEFASKHSICVSTTPGYQNWFVTDNSQLKAVPPPIEADKITSLVAQNNKLLVEYSANGAFKLLLTQVELTDSGCSFKSLHQDSIEGGYFEQIEMGSDALSYDKVKTGEATETVRYVYDSLQDHDE